MITINTLPVPIITQEKTFSLGLEVWQILTVLTLILTLASSLMWFTNLQPENLKQEYLKIDKAKSELYNKAKKTQFNLAELVVPSQDDVRSLNDCYSDVAITSFDGKQVSDQIVYTTQEINQIDVNIKDNVNSISGSGINTLSKGVLDYSVESKTDIEKIELYIKNYQEIQKASIALCQSTLSNLDTKESLLETLSKNQIMGMLDNGLEANIQTLVKMSKSISQTVASVGEASKEEKENFILAMGKVMSVKLSKDSLLTSSGKKFEQVMATISDLEKWQTKFLENKNIKLYPTVWIQTDSK